MDIMTEAEFEQRLIYRETKTGDTFRDRAYRHLGFLNRSRIKTENHAKRRRNPDSPASYGVSGGINHYAHLLTCEDAAQGHNFLLNKDLRIFEAVLARASLGKGVDICRTLGNMASSQACCFNLFVPLQKDLKLASWLFSEWMNLDADVEFIEIEYTPKCDYLNDQSAIGGTDSDVAVILRAGRRRLLILAEFKFIEKEFSKCSSYHNSKRGVQIKEQCLKNTFFESVVRTGLCGYAKYRNWEHTENSRVFDIEKVSSSNACPFRNSGNQLWRNILLAERIAVDPAGSFDDFLFIVFYPQQNVGLWGNRASHLDSSAANRPIENGFRRFLRSDMEHKFQIVELERVVEILENKPGLSTLHRNWLLAFKEKYIDIC